MINISAMPVLLPAQRVAVHHHSSSPAANDLAGALGFDGHAEREGRLGAGAGSLTPAARRSLCRSASVAVRAVAVRW